MVSRPGQKRESMEVDGPSEETGDETHAQERPVVPERPQYGKKKSSLVHQNSNKALTMKKPRRRNCRGLTARERKVIFACKWTCKNGTSHNTNRLIVKNCPQDRETKTPH
eukprot:748795-Hanusia_phi.AAC.8